MLEAVALEVLHRIGLAVGGASLLEWFRERVSKDRQAAVVPPELKERPTQGVAHLWEEDKVVSVGDLGHAVEGDRAAPRNRDVNCLHVRGTAIYLHAERTRARAWCCYAEGIEACRQLLEAV